MSEINHTEGGSSGNSGRKPYESPKIVRVSLRPDEAVLGHCKIPGVAGPGNSSCVALFCRTAGS
jgi:hypothetical protein